MEKEKDEEGLQQETKADTSSIRGTIHAAALAAIILSTFSFSIAGCPDGKAPGKAMERSGGMGSSKKIMQIQDQSRAKMERGPRVIDLETMEDKPFGLRCEI